MKKIILSAFVLGAILVTKNTMAQVSFGPKVGLNLSHISVDGESDFPDHKSKPGFQVGGMLNAQVNEYFVIRPELLFNNVGGKFEGDGVKLTFNTNYLSLPVNFVGQYPISDKFKIQGFVGPYAALGLGGKLRTEATQFGFSFDETSNIKMKKDPNDPNNQNQNDENVYLNSLDFGLNFGLGFQFSSFVFTANYGLGLTNMEPHYKNSDAEDQRGNEGGLYNRNITFGIAYLFGGK